MGQKCKMHREKNEKRKNEKSTIMEYPLYDIPYLVRDPNEFRMSEKRHRIEVRNQAIVDDYFVARANGASAHEARELVATKHGIKPRQVYHSLVWYFQEAKRRHIVVPDL